MATPGAIDLTGFGVEAGGEAVGRVHPATSEVDVTYIVVDAALKPVLLPAGLIEEVDEKARKVVLSCTAEEVRGAPRFDQQRPDLVVDTNEVVVELEELPEPTRDALYEEASRLGVQGRSEMTKDQLGVELERLETEKAGPVHVQAFLEGLTYPADKNDLLAEAEKNRAAAEVRATLERLPNRDFEGPTDVSRALGELP
jgi:Protein of unknown function (DUF2795)